MEYLPQERLTAFLNEKYLDIAADGNRANSNFNDVLYVMVNGRVQYKVRWLLRGLVVGLNEANADT